MTGEGGDQAPRTWDMQKIRDAAFRVRIQQWLEDNEAQVSRKAWEELSRIMEEG